MVPSRDPMGLATQSRKICLWIAKCNANVYIGNHDGVANEKALCRRENGFVRRATALYPGSALHRANAVVEK